MSDPPDPLVSAEVDLSGFGGFMFKYERFLASELAALATAEEGWAAFMLWCRSFQQKPPGSLPDDDRVLAAFSRTGSRWPKVKAMALRGFVKCSDGRLYNRTMAEVSNEAWASRLEHRETIETKTERQKRWRERQRDLSAELREHGVAPPKGASLATLERLLEDATGASHVDAAKRDVDVYKDVSVDAAEMPKKRERREVEGKEPFQGKSPSQNLDSLGELGAGTSPARAHTNEAAPPKPAKAARLPADWTPSSAERSFAQAEGFSAADVDRIADTFRDHWLAQPGQDAAKLDWTATWRNWIRRERKPPAVRGAGALATPGGRATSGVASALAGIDAVFGKLRNDQ